MKPKEPQECRKVPEFRWDAAKRRAAQLVAEGVLSEAEIAGAVGFSERGLRKWKTHAEFAAEVGRIEKELGDLSLRFLVTRKARRLRVLDGRWQGMQRVIEERAADPSMAAVPGGKTGLLVRTIKSVGSGPASQIVEEYEVDTGLLKELREHEKQAATEVGQWTEKHEHGGPGGGAIPVAIVGWEHGGVVGAPQEDAAGGGDG